LNPFEAQYLEPLTSRFDITAAYARSHRYDVESIPFEKIAVPCLDYLNGLIPRQVRGYHIPNILKMLGYDEFLLSRLSFAANFDIIHAPEQAFFSTFQLAKGKSKYKYKFIVVQDEVNPYWYSHKPAVRKRVEFVREKADLFIARSRRAEAALVCEGVDRKKIRVIGHGVDTDRFNPGPRDGELRQQLGISPDRFVILFVGNIVWTKGIFTIANAAKLLLLDEEIKTLDPLFVIVGQGDDLNAVRRQITRLNVDRNFLFAGHQAYSKLPEIHRLADIFVLPSISTRFVLEQFGIVLIESMATGKPVVSTHCGAIDEIVGDAGLLVQPNDYVRLAEALSNLCKDALLRETLAARAIDRVHSKFSAIVVSQRIEAVYREVLRL